MTFAKTTKKLKLLLYKFTRQSDVRSDTNLKKQRTIAYLNHIKVLYCIILNYHFEQC